MASAIIGALRVTLGLDTAAFDSEVAGIGRKMKGIGKVLGAGLALNELQQFAGAVVGAVRQLDDLGDAAEKAGISGEKLQVLRYALEQTTGSAEDADSGMQRFAKSVGELATTGKGPAADAFKALGISIRDASGHLKTQEELLGEVAGKFPLLKNEAQATAIATRLFGKEAGPALATVLKTGQQGLEDFETQLRSIGGLMNEDLLEKADKLDKKFRNLETTIGAGMKVAAVLFAQAATDILGDMSNVADGITEFLEHPSMRTFLESAIGRRPITFRGKPIPFTDPSGLIDMIAGPKTTGDTARDRIGGAFSDASGASEDVDLFMALQKKLHGAIGADISGDEDAARASKRFEEDTQRIQSRIAMLQTEAETIGLTTFEAEKLRVTQDLLNQATEDGITVTPALRAEIEKNATAYAQAAASLDQTQQHFAAVNDLAQQFGQGFIDSFEGLLDKTQSLNDVLADTAKMLRHAALEAIFLGQGPLAQLLGMGAGAPGGTGGLLGGILHAFTGFASGGSFTVGGSGGIDSKLVAFRATPGEMVDIHKPGNDNRAWNPGAMSISIDLAGANGDAAIAMAAEAAARRGAKMALSEFAEQSRAYG